MFQLHGYRALVTGAAGGIGKAIVKALVEAGASVAAVGRQSGQLEELYASNDKVVQLLCDLENLQVVSTLPDLAQQKLGGTVDILICNAGITKDTLALRMKDEDWDKVILVNLTSVFRLNKACLLGMLKNKYGRIINISSIVAQTGNAGQTNYCASKAGLEGMTRSLAHEVASRGITVNTVAPGFITTPMTQGLNEHLNNQIKSRIPMGRMGTPEEIASAVLFLASKEASYITGTTLNISGGLVTS